MEPTTWSDAFTAYLDSLGLSQQDAMFALRRARMRVTQSQISYWCRGSRPREQMRERLERWSKGVVRADLPANLRSSAAESSANDADARAS